jgi:hypothetical protein
LEICAFELFVDALVGHQLDLCVFVILSEVLSGDSPRCHHSLDRSVDSGGRESIDVRACRLGRIVRDEQRIDSGSSEPSNPLDRPGNRVVSSHDCPINIDDCPTVFHILGVTSSHE